MFNQNIKPRALPERSFLYFRYPQPETNKFLDFYIPMLENCQISESQKPNLNTYELVGRPGSLFSYHGSKSRDIKLNFNITLANVVEYLTLYSMDSRFDPQFRMYKEDKEQRKSLFFRGKQYTSKYIPFFNLTSDEFAEHLKSKLSIPQRTTSPLNLNTLRTALSDSNRALRKAVDLIILWTATLRSSVINNSLDTSLGPPSIYLTHGSMYRNIPCVCTGVSIKIKENYGYDIISFTPKVIEVSLDLSENRVGDFGKYEPFERISGDNVTGWESVIKYGTMDPWSNISDRYTGSINSLYDEIMKRTLNQDERAAPKELEAGPQAREGQIEGAQNDVVDFNRIEIQLEGKESGLNESVRLPLKSGDTSQKDTDFTQNPIFRPRDPLTMGDNEGRIKDTDPNPQPRLVEQRKKGLGRNVGPYFRY